MQTTPFTIFILKENLLFMILLTKDMNITAIFYFHPGGVTIIIIKITMILFVLLLLVTVYSGPKPRPSHVLSAVHCETVAPCQH